MKLIQCVNGHFYDGDKMSSCPYCSQDVIDTRAEEIELPSEHGLTGDFEDARTVSYYARKLGVEPVVGWLVAVEGNYFGEDFRLKAGRNFIGRSPEMDVQLGLDPGVSRRRHAIVVYEPKKRVFYAQPGDSGELFYLNDQVVLSPVEMKPHDVLTIGDTKLMLISLCDEHFRWEDWA